MIDLERFDLVSATIHDAYINCIGKPPSTMGPPARKPAKPGVVVIQDPASDCVTAALPEIAQLLSIRSLTVVVVAEVVGRCGNSRSPSDTFSITPPPPSVVVTCHASGTQIYPYVVSSLLFPSRNPP
ncbi:hypothetical protein QBC45DRAFT_415731 [Copromyces sp. CBS 386.78]|nr:hypothetical protein QBC45DRAFT_415731 [Copromyces sp. CBS 386.78]